MKVGRNDPCPCGSGRKAKKCCARPDARPARPAARAAPVHEIDGRMARRLLDFAERRVPLEERRRAVLAWDPDGEGLNRHEVPLHYTWYLHDAPVLGETTVGATYLEERRDDLRSKERELLEAQAKACMSIWEILEIDPGHGFKLRDLLTGDEHDVDEVHASRGPTVRDVLLVRVLEHGGRSYVAGLHPRPLPPRAGNLAVRRVREHLGLEPDEPADHEKLARLTWQMTLLYAWRAAVQAHDDRPPPVLENTDGDPLLLTRDHFRFDAAERDALVASIESMEGAESEPSDDDAPDVTTVTFLREGNAMDPSWDGTVVGRARLVAGKPDRLVLETNSIRRADALRDRVEAASAVTLHFVARDHEDPMSAGDADSVSRRLARFSSGGADADADPDDDEPELPPETLDALREHQQRHLETWIDTPVPALDGLTPREAATHPEKRFELDLILKEVEGREARRPADERIDVSGVRTELGLDG